MSLSPRKKRKFRVPRGFLGTYPRTLLRGEGAHRGRRRAAAAIGLGLACYLVLGIVALRSYRHAPAPPKVVLTQNVQLEKAPPVLPPPPPAPAPQPPAPRAPRQARRAAEPPAAAVAGKVVARAAAAPDQPLDMTGFDMVVGKGDVYAGGFTAAAGTNKNAVDDERATAHGTAPPHASMARGASPLRRDWSCSWPDEEQSGALRDVQVLIRVHVDPDGAPQTVDLLSAAPPGFQRAARQCALDESYRVALDDSGHATGSTTSPVGSSRVDLQACKLEYSIVSPK